MWEVKKILQPVKTTAVDLAAGVIEITNAYNFSDLSDLEGTWQLLADDQVVQSGQVPRLETPPGGSERVTLPLDELEPEPGVEYWLNLSFALAKDTAWAERGHEVAWEQFKMPFEAPSIALLRPEEMPALDLAETEAAVTVKGSGFCLVLDKRGGTISSMQYRDVDLIARGPRLNLWRAPTDNDVKDRNGEVCWHAASLDSLRETVQAVRVEHPRPQMARIEVQTAITPAKTDPQQAAARRRRLLEPLIGYMTQLLDMDGMRALGRQPGVAYDDLPSQDMQSAAAALVLRMDGEDRVLELLQTAFALLDSAPEGTVSDQFRGGTARYRSRTPAELVAEFAPRYEARISCTYTYTVYGSGDVLVDIAFAPQGALPPLPRLGLQMSLPCTYNTFTWYGRGPHESYIDRQEGARVGLYSGTVDAQYEPYIVPQENGNKTDVRWVALTGENGIGLLAVGEPTLNVSAHHFTTQDLTEARHTYELARRDEITLNLDYRQAGLGSASCGPGTRDEYLLRPEPVQFSLRLRPFSARDESPTALSKQGSA